jgi:DNA-binding transcriptional MerR regulator
MATFPLATGARLLGIHPKTLHRWLKAAEFPLAAHPTDARLKCVAEDHLLELARRHGRPLPELAQALGSPEEQASSLPANEADLAPTAAVWPTTSSPEVGLIGHLISLETRIVTLQEQFAQLALALLQEREQGYEQRITALEALLRSSLEGQRVLQQADDLAASPGVLLSRRQCLHPADQRARSRVTALIEYSSQGRYVLVCPHQGEQAFAPDSPQWFEWLATLPSFRFIGQAGRFSAYREYRGRGQTRCWTAFRYFHHRTHKHYMGVTDHLTIDCLEQTAALLQAQLPSL